VNRADQYREREGLVRALSLRFVELRRKAGMRQQDVAEAMGRERSGRRQVRRLERGAVANTSLCSVAEYLRAVRAGFGGLKDALDRYTSVPIPEPVRRLAEIASPPRPQAGHRALALLPGASRRAMVPWSQADEQIVRETVRVQRRAGYWVLRKVFEHFLHRELHAIGASPTLSMRRRMAQYGRKVFAALFRTRGPRERLRPQRLKRLREWALKQQLTEQLAEYLELAVGLMFEDMRAHDELDWMPPPADAFAIMAVKPKRRVVTDAQMCLEEWWDACNRYAGVWQEIDARSRKAAGRVLEAAGCDAAKARLYEPVTTWATKIGSDTAAGTSQRGQSIRQFRDWPHSPRLDRTLLERLLWAVLEVWDANRSTLPPAPGPRPG